MSPTAGYSPEDLLTKFGLSSFRAGQREAIAAALAGRDSLVVMPTAGGKSLCYQLPALAGQGLVVVVSPLIALMADQLGKLNTMGVRATMVASGMSETHNARALRDLATGRTRLILVAPERFASSPFLQALRKRKVALFVVDEAHCVAEWGHDFRPDYLRLGAAIAALGRPPVMAVTATATPAVATEIAERLGLRDWVRVSSGFDRPNLSFDVVRLNASHVGAHKSRVLLTVLGKPESRPAIVYCATRRETELVTDFLVSAGMSAVTYHAGLDPQQRESAQASFMGGQSEIIVATNAFGMGIDKADVRTVLHLALPRSLEAYYQEAGRAGRDGRPARALLFTAPSDLPRLIRLNNLRNISVDDVQIYVELLAQQLRGGLLARNRMSAPERVLLSVAERSGALELAPGRRGDLHVRLTGTIDLDAAHAAARTASDRGWDSYRTIERFVTTTAVCRRAQILQHFGESEPGAPTGRCCDVCDPDTAVQQLAGPTPPTKLELPVDPDDPPPPDNDPPGPEDDLSAPEDDPPEHPADSQPHVNDLPDTADEPPRPPDGLSAQLAPHSRVRPRAHLPGWPRRNVDPAHFEKLSAWRRERAGAGPAYTVASNALLEDVLCRSPRTTGDLLEIRGIGRGFCEKHGDSLLSALNEL